MNKDSNRDKDKNLDKNPKANENPVDRSKSEINHGTRTWEDSRNPDSDNDRKGRNKDIDAEDQWNEMEGREQQTTPKNSTQEVVDRFNSRDEQRKNENNK